MAGERPYFKHGIASLESIFESSRSNAAICKALVEELKQRKTARAAELLTQVKAALAEISVPKPQEREKPFRQSTPPREDAAPSAVTEEQVAPKPSTPRSNLSPNTPEAILAAWTAMEALSPQTYRRPADLVNGDRRCVALLDGDDLPWFRGEKSRPKQKLYYQVVLGSVHVDRATDALIHVFGEDEERSAREREKAALAAILVDKDGFLLKESAVAISSFGWALPIALAGDLAGLGAWVEAERPLVDGLTKQLSRQDRDGNAMPLDATVLNKAFQWLVASLRLPTGLYEEPSFVLRIFHYFKSKTPPEVTLLNSFFLSDLARATSLVRNGQTNRVLERYLGAEKVSHSPNLLENLSLVESLVAPAQTPATRWPAPGGHPLVTLQQAAVNASRMELAGGKAGIVAVNGPPGTGKTTLLRDIVASCVLDRATAMAEFDDPGTAFKTTGLKVSAGSSAFFHLYSLDASLKGHEVLVASSNNKAVENVSKELPALKAIGRDVTYFKTVSDRALSKRAESGEVVVGEPTWGLIAAVLGNAKNRQAFQEALWWDDDKSLRLYLKAARGDSVVREIKDESGNVVRREVPSIIEAEAPPSPEEARVNWRKARSRFKTLRSEVEVELRLLESVRKVCLSIPSARGAVNTASSDLIIAAQAMSAQEAVVNTAQANLLTAEAAKVDAIQAEQSAFSSRPSWWHRLFNTQRMKAWRSIYDPLLSARQTSERRSEAASIAYKNSTVLFYEAEANVQSAQQALEKQEAKLSSLEQEIDSHRPRLGSRLVDEGFFVKGHEQWNLASPWLPDTLHQKREELFVAALELHRAFIDVSAQRISHNVGVLMGAMQVGALHEEEKKALLGDLWSTLFLICPVVSTTFASVDRMLGDLPAASFGWALVDEAGQATPQSAVGMLMRAKRAIVVGDPLQIPPVVSLPQRLVSEIGKFFGLETNKWLAPEASVQTLADQASRLKAEFQADVGVREVGLPLLVHRRCQEPMFGISNRIAYDGQMVYAAGNPSIGSVAQTLGNSQWFDIDATAESKWCAEEGECVIQILSKLAMAGVQQPDIYIITPFRIIAQELRRRIESESGLLQSLGVDADEWLRDRVGTIHTFQGKEAEAVIAVLGAPMSAQQGARRWAASTPNIFNVMVSRAKQRLYIVGSRAVWSTVGHGKAVSSALNRT